MAIRWKDQGLGVEHGYLMGTRVFTLLAPASKAGDYTMTSDLPGAAAGSLVTHTFESAEDAKRRAHQFARAWLLRHTLWLEEEPHPGDGPTWWEPSNRVAVYSVNGSLVYEQYEQRAEQLISERQKRDKEEGL